MHYTDLLLDRQIGTSNKLNRYLSLAHFQLTIAIVVGRARPVFDLKIFEKFRHGFVRLLYKIRNIVLRQVLRRYCGKYVDHHVTLKRAGFSRSAHDFR